MNTKPNHWVVGSSTKDGFTVARVRQFFAVLKKQDDDDTTWAVELINGKRLKATSSADAGEKGRAYPGRAAGEGIKVERTSRAKAPAKKATAKKATAKKAPAKK